MGFAIPKNSPQVQVTGVLITAGMTGKGSELCQILFEEPAMGIEEKKHVLDIWGPENFSEVSKLVGSNVTVACAKSSNDDGKLYRARKGSRIVPVKT